MTQPDSVMRELILAQLADQRAWWQELCASHEQWEEMVVRALRRAGASWRDVGEALQTTRQAAWERFSHVEGMGDDE